MQGDCSLEPGSGEDRSQRGNRCRRPLWMLLWAHNQWVPLSWLLDLGPKYNTSLSTVADNYGLAAYGLYLFLLTIWWSMVIKILIETKNNKNWLYEIVNTTNEPLNRNGATQLPALTTILKSVSKETWAGGHEFLEGNLIGFRNSSYTDFFLLRLPSVYLTIACLFL